MHPPPHPDHTGIERVGEELLKPEKGEPASLRLSYLFFGIIGFAHTYTWKTLGLFLLVYVGYCATRVTRWKMSRLGVRFDMWSSLFIEATVFAVGYYVTGWVFGALSRYFGWI